MKAASFDRPQRFTGSHQLIVAGGNNQGGQIDPVLRSLGIVTREDFHGDQVRNGRHGNRNPDQQFDRLGRRDNFWFNAGRSK